MEMSDQQSATRVAVIPLLGNEQTDDALWLGAVLSRLLGQHLSAAAFSVADYNFVAEQVSRGPYVLPLDSTSIESLYESLKAKALVHGRYVLDEAGRMLGFRLWVEAPDIPRIPLEVSTPLPEFNPFMERVSLAVIEQLGTVIDESLRQRLANIARPATFEALRQLARAYAAWSRHQNELALAAITSTLAIDPQFEEAAALEVAIARMTSDAQTTRAAFRRWAGIAEKQGKPLVAADRLLMLGHWLVEHSEWEEARRAYDDARSVFLRQKHAYGEAQAINNLANLELLRGKYQNAIGAYRRNLRVLEDQPEMEADKARTLYNLCLAHKNLGQRDEAKRAVEEALAQARHLNDRRLEASCLMQRGALNDDLGQWTHAASDYANASRLFELMGDEKSLAQVKTHQAILLKQQGNYDRAESLLRQTLQALEKMKDRHELAVARLNLADLYLSMGLYDQAWNYAERAHEVLAELKSGALDRAQAVLDALDAIDIASSAETPVQPNLSPPSDPPLDVFKTVTMLTHHDEREMIFDEGATPEITETLSEDPDEDDNHAL